MPRAKNPETPAAPARRAPRKRAAAEPAERTTGYPSFVDPQQRAGLIAQAAYFRAQKRGFAPGHEMEDWLAAEAEVDADLLKGTAAS
jgi:hypothetical protein